MIEFDIEKETDTRFHRWEDLWSWVETSLVAEGFVLGDLNFVFMSDNELLEFNRKFLNHDYFTDVITFDDCEGLVVNGDILISIDRIVDNAKMLENKYLDEFCRVVIHGVLHLCGYKDKADLDELLMRSTEQKYLDLRSFT
ncbi:MAG: putative rRNA maturation factor [Salibacteraceae bacterium]|jgi:rRNA maturation RNase YbeY